MFGLQRVVSRQANPPSMPCLQAQAAAGAPAAGGGGGGGGTVGGDMGGQLLVVRAECLPRQVAAAGPGATGLGGGVTEVCETNHPPARLFDISIHPTHVHPPTAPPGQGGSSRVSPGRSG